MPFDYSCFISYRRGKYELMQRFVKEFEGALRSCIEPYLDKEVFIDEDGLQGGDFYNVGLAEALHKSVCMILIFTPTYFNRQHPYCAREYAAMKALEKKRFDLIGRTIDRKRGLIIPILFRGRPEDIPVEISKSRHYYDFSKFGLVKQNLIDYPQYIKYIEEIAERIYYIHEELEKTETNLFDDYDEFTLPAEEEIREWLEGVIALKRPFPFAQGVY